MSLQAILSIIALCFFVARTHSVRIMALDGISTNIQITCSESGRAFGGSSFWMINNNIYGLLHVPKEFTACTQVICAPENLFIPLVLREMNETRFECVHINYQNSTNFLGQLTELTVITSPLAFTELNGTKRDVLELDYNQLSIGTVNTSITWRYSSLKCRPSVFFVEFFIERAAIGNQSSLPTLRLNSTTTSITIPTSDIQHHITSGALYLRLLAYDETGAACASDSAARFYKLNINATSSIPIFMPPVGEVCVPIPIDLSSGHDYSSLEVVWPEHGTGGRLCYCPPYEGEHQLFSRCTSTVSCNTSHSISISNNSVCFAHLRQGLDKVSVFFTLLDYCYNYRCAVQSIVASFNIFVMSANEVEITTGANDLSCQGSDCITLQFHIQVNSNCEEWILIQQPLKLQEVATELNTYIGQKCDCFPLTYITSAQFTCPIFPPPHPQHYVTYRANIAPTGQLNRTELEAVLREWLAVHRAILLQGELLSVDNTCPIIINSFDDEQCTHDPITTTMDATLLPSDTHPVTLSLTSFLISVMAVAGLALIIVLLISLFFFTLYRKKKGQFAATMVQPTGHVEAPGSVSPPFPSPDKPAVPEYEEILDLHGARNRGGEHVPKEGYQFTNCPAYAVTSTV